MPLSSIWRVLVIIVVTTCVTMIVVVVLLYFRHFIGCIVIEHLIRKDRLLLYHGSSDGFDAKVVVIHSTTTSGNESMTTETMRER